MIRMAVIPNHIEDAARRYEQRADERRQRSRALHDLSQGKGDPASLATQVDAPMRIATRAVSAGFATSTGEVLAGPAGATAVLLERIIGEANLLPARFLQAGARRAAAVGRIVVRSPGGATTSRAPCCPPRKRGCEGAPPCCDVRGDR